LRPPGRASFHPLPRLRFAPLECDEIAVHNIGPDHRITRHPPKPELGGAGRFHPEHRRIDPQRFLHLLLLHRGSPRRDRAIHGHLKQVPLHGGGFEAPFSVGEFLQLRFLRERLEVPQNRRLRRAELPRDLAGRGRHGVDALILADKIQNLFLTFGEHGEDWFEDTYQLIGTHLNRPAPENQAT
jgi:hypothetical protein